MEHAIFINKEKAMKRASQTFFKGYINIIPAFKKSEFIGYKVRFTDLEGQSHYLLEDDV